MKKQIKLLALVSILISINTNVALAASQNSAPTPSLNKQQTKCLANQGIKISSNQPPANVDFGKLQKAFKACKINFQMPSGMGNINPDSKEFKAFQSCLKKYKIDGSNPLSLDQSDPTTAVALVKCQKSTGFKIPNLGANQ